MTADDHLGRSDLSLASDLPPQPPYVHILSTEIRLQIFKELDAKDLLSTALVCKLWSGLAIDTVWRNFPIRLSCLLAPLTNTSASMLQDCWDPGALPPIPDPGNVPAERWQTQRDRARKITWLIVDVTWKRARAADLEKLVVPHGGPMCSNLKSMTLIINGKEPRSEDDDHWTPLLPYIVGNGLENLTLHASKVGERVFQDIINTLARIAPRIHTALIITATKPSPDYSALSQLRSLDVVGPVCQDTWKALADCPQLESMVLQDEIDTDPDMDGYSVSFTRLKRLKISFDDEVSQGYAFILTRLRNTAMPALETLELKLQIEANDEAEYEAMKKDLVQMVRRRSPMLREVQINGPIPGRDSITGRTYGWYSNGEEEGSGSSQASVVSNTQGAEGLPVSVRAEPESV
ncbi:hypothetical protein FRB95_006350 [Tulasnella sp. JGI-2019a]|nr:hypothetical protein FRB95_006350 [Tulasnella sp. JGI-2019a]